MKSINGSLFWGFLTFYSGGGYIFNLGNDASAAEADLKQLEDAGWIDQFTRAIFVEFSVWNANTNLMSSFTLCLEFPPSGGLFTWTEIEFVNLYRYSGAAGVLNLFAELLILVYMVVFTVLTIKDVLHQKMQYFKVFWNDVMLVAIVLFYVALVCYVMRTLWTVTCVENMMNNPGKYRFKVALNERSTFLLFQVTTSTSRP
jgi:hypothetical protein